MATHKFAVSFVVTESACIILSSYESSSLSKYSSQITFIMSLIIFSI